MASWSYRDSTGAYIAAVANEVKPQQVVSGVLFFDIRGTSVGASDFFWFHTSIFMKHMASEFYTSSGTVTPKWGRDEALSLVGTLLETEAASTAQKVTHLQTPNLIVPNRRIYVMPVTSTSASVDVLIAIGHGLGDSGL